MNLLPISLFFAIFFSGYLAEEAALLPSYFALLPEGLSGIAMLYVFGRCMTGRSLAVDWRYASFVSLLLLTLLFGFLVQRVTAGAMVAGIREHVKFIPFFLLPAAYAFTPRQLKLQAIVLLMVLAVQVPLAFYQRFVEFADKMHTGDPIRGTVSTSSALSLLLLGGISVFVALYLKGKLRLPLMLVAVAAFFVPTTLNETKATLLLLPIALLLPAFLMPRGAGAFRKLIPIVAIGSIAATAYVAVYDYFIQYRQYGEPIESFIGDEAYERYLYTGAPAAGERQAIGRFDSIRIAVDHLKGDPLDLAFGLGAGNVSESQLAGFDGRYAVYYERYGVSLTQVTNFLWQVGVVGLAAYLLFYWLVYRDARMLARDDETFSILGQIWATTTVIMALALLYKSVFTMNEIGYLFWFYSGMVASKAYALRRQQRQPRTEPARLRPPAQAVYLR